MDRGEVGLYIESVSATFVAVPSSLASVLDRSDTGEAWQKGSLNCCRKRLNFLKKPYFSDCCKRSGRTYVGVGFNSLHWGVLALGSLLMTWWRIHLKQAQYSFTASWPKAKKTKNRTAEAGIVHQAQKAMSRANGGIKAVGNWPTRPKSEWTLSHETHSRSPERHENHMLRPMTKAPQTIWTTAIAMRRKYFEVVRAELDCWRWRAKVMRRIKKWWRARAEQNVTGGARKYDGRTYMQRL